MMPLEGRGFESHPLRQAKCGVFRVVPPFREAELFCYNAVACIMTDLFFARKLQVPFSLCYTAVDSVESALAIASALSFLLSLSTWLYTLLVVPMSL